jgi:hypothetical protein
MQTPGDASRTSPKVVASGLLVLERAREKGSSRVASRTSFVSHLPNASWRVLAEHVVK